jgi:muramoyltetrapeptide carboxypeptidase
VKGLRLLKPPAVVPGAAFSIVAPASSAKPDRVDAGRNALRALGYLPEFSRNALEREPLYFAGTPGQRLDDLDFDVIASHPKPLFAYSDLTGVQLRLLDELGIPAFHGPMLAADFYLDDGVHLPSFKAALAGEPYSVGAAEGLRLLKRGSGPSVVGGTLYGGCLTLIASLLATPWEPCTEGTLLFLEDLAVKPYQIDRMLWQLRHARKLDGVTGIIFGEMVDCFSPGAPPDLLEDAILSALADFPGPIAIGLRSGHVSRQNVTLTFGIEAELVTDGETQLHLLEPAVTP